MQETDYVDGTKGEGRFKSSQSVQYCNLNLTMQLYEEMKRFSEQGDNVKWMGKCGPHNYL
jgi:hypothetical protein